MSVLFTLLAHAGGTPMRLVDGVCCPQCGTQLVRPTLEVVGPRRPVAQRVLCLECGDVSDAERRS